MVALAIHTSSPELGLALGGMDQPVKRQVWPLGRDLSTYFHTHLEQFMEAQSWQELSLLAVAIGPGGFTGTRIGVVAARTLAQQLELPLFGISSLAAITTPQPKQDGPTHVAVQMQAQRSQVFGAIYEITPEGLITHLPDQVFSPAAWQQTLDTWPHPHRLVSAEAGLAASVDQVLHLALQQWQAGLRPQWSEVLPYYGQHPVSSP